MQSQPNPYSEDEARADLNLFLLEPVSSTDPYPAPYTVEITVYITDGVSKFHIEGFVTDPDREGDFTYNLVALQRWEDQDPANFPGLAFKATYRVSYILGYTEGLRYESFLQDQWEADTFDRDWETRL